MRFLTIIAAFFCLSHPAFGQSLWSYDDHSMSLKIPEMSLVTIMPANHTVNLSLSLPVRAGAKPGTGDSSVDDKTWLNYSCSVKQKGAHRKVYAQITSGNVPDGIDLELQVSNLKLKGRGKCGRRYTTKTVLTNQPQVVVCRIGGGCTRRGKQYGHQLTYSIKLKDIDDLIVKEPKTYVTVTYTISD
jgi:hypothetical protein